MRKSVIVISLFLLGTAFSVKAQEMTQKEKNSYAIGVMLGEKIKEKIKESGIDMNTVDSIREKLKEKIDFEFIKKGINDDFKNESKLTKEEIGAALVELAKEKADLDKMLNANQSKGSENENSSSAGLTKDNDYLTILARDHGNLSWYYLFIKDYAQSERSARQALKLDSTQTWVKVNLAHALLFRNHFSKAEKIYKELSQTKMEGNETYTKTILGDFDELGKAGVIPVKHKTDVEKIRKMLQE